jgi:hypothetical protein
MFLISSAYQSRFALRLSTIKVRFNETLSQYRVLVGPRHDGRLADWGLPDWGLANRHLADMSLLIDGLWAREVGRASGSHQGKRCTRYNHNFRHDTSPQGSNLLSVLLRHAVSMNVGMRLQCGRPGSIRRRCQGDIDDRPTLVS